MQSYRARAILPVEGAMLAGGYLTTVGPSISAVTEECPSGNVTDLGDVVLLPGLINAHTHLEFSHLSHPLGQPGMAFESWIPLVVSERRQRNVCTKECITRGLRESLSAGVTLVGEIATSGWESPEQFPRGPDCVVFQEVLGLKPDTLTHNRAKLAEHFARCWSTSNNSPRHVPGISPHAPYTVSDALFAETLTWAMQYQAPLAFHLAESAAEMELLRYMRGPLKEQLQAVGFWESAEHTRPHPPLSYMEQLARIPRGLIVHGNYLGDGEVSFLATHAARLSVIYCPRTHAYFGHPPHPLPRLLAAGAQVAIGTDSRASNPDLSLLNELKFLREQHPDLAPAEVLRLGTLAGARALGYAEQTGSLAVGKEATCVAVAIDSQIQDPAAAVLEPASRVMGVMQRGRWVCGDAAFLANIPREINDSQHAATDGNC